MQKKWKIPGVHDIIDWKSRGSTSKKLISSSSKLSAVAQKVYKKIKKRKKDFYKKA